MTQMRWLKRPTGQKLDGTQIVQTFEQVLQYRVYQNTAIYAGMPDQDFVNRTAKMAWSEWMDVPTVIEETK